MELASIKPNLVIYTFYNKFTILVFVFDSKFTVLIFGFTIEVSLQGRLIREGKHLICQIEQDGFLRCENQDRYGFKEQCDNLEYYEE